MDRPQIIEKLMFGEYLPLNSYFAATPYENPDNPKNDYDPQAALKLLADAGWNSRDSQGRLAKDGIPLEVELLYDSKIEEPSIYRLPGGFAQGRNQRESSPGHSRNALPAHQQPQFQMVDIAWGGLLFPNPETPWLSSLADAEQ